MARRDFNPTRMAWFDKRKVSVQEMECQVRSLDTFDFEPGFIKIDVEGCEIDVLRGAQSIIARKSPFFLVENNDNRLVADFLGERGYTPYAWRDGALIAGVKGLQNTFYVNSNRVDDIDPLMIRAKGA